MVFRVPGLAVTGVVSWGAWALTEPWRNCRKEVKLTRFPQGVRSQRRKRSVPHPAVGTRAEVTRTGYVWEIVLQPGLRHALVCGRPRGTEEHSGQREQQAEGRWRDRAACPGALRWAGRVWRQEGEEDAEMNEDRLCGPGSTMPPRRPGEAPEGGEQEKGVVGHKDTHWP